jgi:hypothetical protein
VLARAVPWPRDDTIKQPVGDARCGRAGGVKAQRLARSRGGTTSRVRDGWTWLKDADESSQGILHTAAIQLTIRPAAAKIFSSPSPQLHQSRVRQIGGGNCLSGRVKRRRQVTLAIHPHHVHPVFLSSPAPPRPSRRGTGTGTPVSVYVRP